MAVLLLTRSADVHDAVVPLCAAAGVAADVCASPELALASWSDADLVLVGVDLADDVVRVAGAVSRARPFIVTADYHPGRTLDHAGLRAKLAPRPQQLSLFG